MVMFGSLYATSGEDVYKAHCMSCHAIQNTKSFKMRAPGMPMVSMRLKNSLKEKEAFVTFVTDYIQNPSQEKGHCMPMAYKRFGTMPPIGKSLTKEQRNAVALWLYENFKGSWSESMGGKSCEMRNAKKQNAMKCGAGKCGGAESTQKNSAKCGAVSIPTH